MKNTRSILLYFLFIFAISCNTTAPKKMNTPELSTKKAVEKIAHIELDIEGMTCEIGCAKIIESKVSKLQGVQFSKVSFIDKKGTFTYDENSISKEDIIKKINGIAGGDLYTVTKIKTLDSIPKQEI